MLHNMMVVTVEDENLAKQALDALRQFSANQEKPLMAAAILMNASGQLTQSAMTSGCASDPKFSLDRVSEQTLRQILSPGRALLLVDVPDGDEGMNVLLFVMLLLASAAKKAALRREHDCKDSKQSLSTKVEEYQSAIKRLDYLRPTATANDIDVAFQAVDRAYESLRHTLLREQKLIDSNAK